MKKFALFLVLPWLAACGEEPMPMETDISEANRATVCPADVSEADRYLYPAC